MNADFPGVVFENVVDRSYGRPTLLCKASRRGCDRVVFSHGGGASSEIPVAGELGRISVFRREWRDFLAKRRTESCQHSGCCQWRPYLFRTDLLARESA